MNIFLTFFLNMLILLQVQIFSFKLFHNITPILLIVKDLFFELQGLT